MIDIGEITVEQFLQVQKKRNESIQAFEENPFSLINNEIEQLCIVTGKRVLQYYAYHRT